MRKLFILVALLVLVSGTAMAQDHPKAEIFGGYSFLRVNPGQGVSGENFAGGWHASIAGNVNNWFGVVGEFSGHYKTIAGVKTNAHSFTFGPRISYRNNEKVTPFAHVTFGGVRLGGGGTSENAFAMTFGGGVDAKINDNVAFRVAQFDYILTRFDGPVTGSNANQHNFRISTGIVFRFN
ncbi:MAG: outer membrane beta-barrel protein [Acidobacteria bacterium]|nr:outer membrane beta-barrel protein [Acidobacteriota bacterium]